MRATKTDFGLVLTMVAKTFGLKIPNFDMVCIGWRDEDSEEEEIK